MAAKRRGCLPGLTLLALAGAVVAFLWFLVTAPWIYTVGRTRPIPLWQGQAMANGPGGTYRFFIQFWPSTGPAVRPATWARGTGWVCTPQGKSYWFRVTGSTDRVVWKDMNGAPFHLFTSGKATIARSTMGRRGLPALEFRGRWNGDRLELRDEGTIAASFAADGGLIKRPGPAPGSPQAITFDERAWGFFFDPC